MIANTDRFYAGGYVDIRIAIGLASLGLSGLGIGWPSSASASEGSIAAWSARGTLKQRSNLGRASMRTRTRPLSVGSYLTVAVHFVRGRS